MAVHTLAFSLEQATVVQYVRGRSEGEDIVVETLQVQPGLLDAPPPSTLIGHSQQLGAQVVEPQHIGVGLVVTPLVTVGERERQVRERQVTTHTPNNHPHQCTRSPW